MMGILLDPPSTRTDSIRQQLIVLYDWGKVTTEKLNEALNSMPAGTSDNTQVLKELRGLRQQLTALDNRLRALQEGGGANGS